MSRLIARDRRAVPVESMLTPYDHLGYLSMLHTAGVIGKSGYSLGAQILHYMHIAQVRQVCRSIEELVSVTVTNDMGIVAGPIYPSIFPVIEALQELHMKAKILNATREVDLNKPDAELSHFTLDPRISAGIHWTLRTPITFRLADESAATVADQLRKMTAAVLDGTTIITWGQA